MARRVTPETHHWVKHLVQTTSVRRAAKLIGIADGTVTRVVADLPVQDGTALLVEMASPPREEAA